MGKACTLALLLGALASAGIAAPSDRAAAVKKPLFTIVYTRAGDKPISGHLVKWTKRAASIQLANGHIQRVRWASLTPGSAFTLRARLIDQKSAKAWFALGEFGWRLGAKPQARMAFNRAVGLDHSLKAAALRVMQRGSNAPAPATRHMGHSPHKRGNTAADRAEVRAAIAKAAADAKTFHFHFHKIETRHFIIFTEWNPREDTLIKKATATAYARIAKFLKLKRHARIFRGKLCMELLARWSFQRQRRIDGKTAINVNWCRFIPDPGGKTMHVVMYRPNQNVITLDNAYDRDVFIDRVFDCVAFAMLQRYNGPRPVPPWIPVGLGDGLGSSPALLQNTLASAYFMAKQGRRVADILAGKNCREGLRAWTTSNAAATIAATLMQRGPKRFLKFINAIKAGDSEPKALKKVYKINNARLQHAWRLYCLHWGKMNGYN